VSHSSYDGLPHRPVDYTSSGTSKGHTAKNTPKGNGKTASSSQSSVKSGSTKDYGIEHPLALSPTDPDWQDVTSIAPGPRMNATFVTLARNSDVWEIARSIRQVEDRFNKRYNYDWVFLNDKPFDETFKSVTSSLVSGKTHYGEIAEEHWSFPDFIDQDKAKKVREDMAQKKIIYGDSISYRHMCRFESGFFFRQPLMMNYEYYWRVEPSVELFCDIHYDPFRFMHENKKKYSFVISLYEYVETIPTLWDSVKKFMKNHPEHIADGNAMQFLSNDNGETYNHCHFVCCTLTSSKTASLTIISGPISKSEVSPGCDPRPILTISPLSTKMVAFSMSVGAMHRSTPLPPRLC
jgi:alpha 1,2-mannosyltransferase